MLEEVVKLPLALAWLRLEGVTTLGGRDSHLCVVIDLGQLTHQSWHKSVNSMLSMWLRPQMANIWDTSSANSHPTQITLNDVATHLGPWVQLVTPSIGQTRQNPSKPAARQVAWWNLLGYSPCCRQQTSLHTSLPVTCSGSTGSILEYAS